MIIFYEKETKRFIGTLDAPTNRWGVKIIPNGVKPKNVVEKSINPKRLKEIEKLRRISPAHIKVKLDKKGKIAGFEQEPSKISYNDLKRAKEERDSKIAKSIKEVKSKSLSAKKRLDALSNLINLKASVIENTGI